MPTPTDRPPPPLPLPASAIRSGRAPVQAPAGLKAVDKETTAGILFGFGAYGLWGLLPLYFFVLQPAGAVEIVANRVVWSLLFCALLITVTRSWRALAAAFRNRAVFGALAIAAALSP